MSVESLFQSGHVALIILAVMAVELDLLRHRLRDMPFFAASLATGACLVLALRAALLDHGWSAVALFLVLSLAFHILELQLCLRHARRPRP